MLLPNADDWLGLVVVLLLNDVPLAVVSEDTKFF
jgi:hypothetical protein